MADGGRNAARGLRYQYLRTLEALMDVVERVDHDGGSIHVEGLPDADGSYADSVDYELTNRDQQLLSVVQVKARAPEFTMGAGEIFGALAALVREREACRYELLTNARAGDSARGLAAALNSQADTQALRVTLDRILRPAGRRRNELRRLDNKHLLRLSRATVEFDPRDDTEISDSLIARLRHYRNLRYAGLGEQSAGLMIGYLLSEIFRRAGNATEATFTIAEFEALLMVDGLTLARSLGHRDWGIVVGPAPAMPDVRRTELLSQVHAVFPFAGSETAISRCTLTGMSGIGKTSLAAGYLLDRADAYDAIFWVDAESEQTLASSFERIFRFICSSENRLMPSDPAQLRDDVHAGLSRSAGTWLLVLDNCASPRLAETWIPRAGSGHVIVTTTDSSQPPRNGTTIAVTAMDTGQAVELLTHRLGPLSENSRAQKKLLEQLAAKMERWPLALELAASYIHGSGLGIEGIPEYLRRLKLRSLDDYRSIPPDYPRTLVQAIALCLERINEQANRPEHQGIPAAVALTVIKLAAYMASQRIPVYLLASVPMIDPDVSGFRGMQPVVVDAPNCPATEIVATLRAQSLVAFDEPLPGDGVNDDTRFDQTISINAILQEVIRGWLDHSLHTHEALDRLAWHTERWMKAAFELCAHSRALILTAHAEAIDTHAARLGVQTDYVAYLRGNLASLYLRQHNEAKAVSLLRAEISHFANRTEEHARLLTCQASMQLASVLVEDENPDTEQVVSLIENAFLIARENALTAPEGTSFLMDTIRTVLKNVELKHMIHPKLAPLTVAVGDLIGRLPSTFLTETRTKLSDAETALRERETQRTIELCRSVLGEEFLVEESQIQTQIRCEARRILVEALLWTDNLAAASTELDTLLREAQPPAFFVRQLQQVIHNAGLRCAWLAIVSKIPEAVNLLAQMLDGGNADLIEAAYPGETAARIRLLRAADSLAAGDVTRAGQYMDSAAEEFSRQASSAQRQAWIGLTTILAAEVNYLSMRQTGKGTARGSHDHIRYMRYIHSMLKGLEGRYFLPWIASSMMEVLAAVSVDMIPLYAALTLIHSTMSGSPAEICVPACYQLMEALGHLGFDAEVMAACVTVFPRENPEAGHFDVGVWDRAPTIQLDGTTDGHAVLWAGSFSRLVDPVIPQSPRLLAAAQQDIRFTHPVVLPMTDREQLFASASLVSFRDPFMLSWMLFPERTDAFTPALAGDLGATLPYAGLLLAHTTLGLIQALGELRGDLDRLHSRYARLGRLLTGRSQLPELPDEPPT